METSRAWIAIALAASLIGAGCLGAGEDGAAGDLETSSEESGETDTEPEPNATRAEAPEQADANLTTREFTFEGQLGAEAYVCSLECVGTYSCVGETCTGTRDPRIERSFEIEHDGTLRGVNATLQWDALSPVTETLRVGVAWNCDDGCQYDFVDGQAPLELTADDLEIEDEAYVFVWQPDLAEDVPAYVGATHDQPFTVTGTATVQAG